MRPVSGLTVIGCPYGYSGWYVEITDGMPVIYSQIKLLQHREISIYADSGVFHTMGVPVSFADMDIQRYQQYEPYEGLTRNVSDAVCSAVRQGNAVLFAGGYCNYAPAVAGGLQRAIGKEQTIGVVWIDAHADCRIPGRSAVSPTRLVSVPVSTLSGIADDTLRDYRERICGLNVPCRGENIIASDIRILDEETARNLVSAGIVRLDASEFASEERWNEAVRGLAERVDAIYLSVDADILKHAYIPSYSKEVPYGQELDTVVKNVAAVTATGKVCAISLFCFNFDIDAEDVSRTYQSAVEIMKGALGSWKQVPLPSPIQKVIDKPPLKRYNTVD